MKIPDAAKTDFAFLLSHAYETMQ